MCDVLVLHGCLVVLSILPPFLLFFLVGEWGVEGEAACSQGHAFVCLCVCVCVVGERRGEEEEERGKVAAGKASQGREGKRERGRRGK